MISRIEFHSLPMPKSSWFCPHFWKIKYPGNISFKNNNFSILSNWAKNKPLREMMREMCENLSLASFLSQTKSSQFGKLFWKLDIQSISPWRTESGVGYSRQATITKMRAIIREMCQKIPYCIHLVYVLLFSPSDPKVNSSLLATKF